MNELLNTTWRFLCAAFLAKFPVHLAGAAFGAYPASILNPQNILVFGVLGSIALAVMVNVKRPWLIVAVGAAFFLLHDVWSLTSRLDIIQPSDWQSWEFQRDWAAVFLMHLGFLPAVLLMGKLFKVLPHPKNSSDDLVTAS